MNGAVLPNGGNMSSVGAIWGVIKLVATRVPWGRVVENAPAVVDLVARAKDRLKGASQGELEEQLALIHQQNLMLEKTLSATADHLEELSKKLEAVSRKQKKLAIITVLSLMIAMLSVVLWSIK
jgi:hypothetical protein